jgi:hypothetical protein
MTVAGGFLQDQPAEEGRDEGKRGIDDRDMGDGGIAQAADKEKHRKAGKQGIGPARTAKAAEIAEALGPLQPPQDDQQARRPGQPAPEDQRGRIDCDGAGKEAGGAPGQSGTEKHQDALAVGIYHGSGALGRSGHCVGSWP